MVSGSWDGTLRVWDAAPGKCLKILEGHGGSVNCAAVLDDGRVVSGSDDHTLRVWDAASGQCLKTLKGHGGSVNCATSLDDGRVVSGSDDRTLRVWEAASGQCLKILEEHGGSVRCLAVLDDGRVVSGSRDNTLRVWDVETGESLPPFEEHGGSVRCLAALDDGRVVSGSDDGTLRVWDAASGKCLKILEGHGGPVICAAVLDDGRLVSGSWDGTVRIWDKDTFSCIGILSVDPQVMLLNKIRHYCIDYIGFLARNGEYFTAGDDGQYAGFRRVDGEDCCYEIPLKTDGGDEEAREKLYSFMTEFIQKYRYTCEPVYTVDFDWGLSSGEENMLRMFSNLFHVFTRDFSSGNYGECRIYNDEFRMDRYNETDECSSVMLFLDEADLTLHPEWQRRLIRLLTAFLPSIYPETCVKDMQLVLSTHSPLLLGDIPSENISYLGKDNDVPGETFGQNIHTILRDGFFLESGTVGAFAGARINGIADRLEEIIENEGKKEKTDGEEVLKNEDKNKNANNKPYIRPSENELADIRKTIDIVANGILRVWLEGKWLETNAVLSEPLCSEEAKKLVEEAKKLPPEEKRYILRELLGEDGK
ncbi:MAG: AAA family ATPase [Clostridia bacterium]|nr:AAA family ATPase [Clostridia bacterium]